MSCKIKIYLHKIYLCKFYFILFILVKCFKFLKLVIFLIYLSWWFKLPAIYAVNMVCNLFHCVGNSLLPQEFLCCVLFLWIYFNQGFFIWYVIFFYLHFLNISVALVRSQNLLKIILFIIVDTFRSCNLQIVTFS